MAGRNLRTKVRKNQQKKTSGISTVKRGLNIIGDAAASVAISRPVGEFAKLSSEGEAARKSKKAAKKIKRRLGAKRVLRSAKLANKAFTLKKRK